MKNSKLNSRLTEDSFVLVISSYEIIRVSIKSIPFSLVLIEDPHFPSLFLVYYVLCMLSYFSCLFLLFFEIKSRGRFVLNYHVIRHRLVPLSDGLSLNFTTYFIFLPASSTFVIARNSFYSTILQLKQTQ